MSVEQLDIKELLDQILSDPEAALRHWRGGGIPIQLLRELYAKHNHYEVECFLAGYGETPSRILEELCEKSKSVRVLSLLAVHPRTPKSSLMQLCRDERVELRLAVAASKEISPQTALVLCEDSDAFVRSALARNSAITVRVQAILSNDAVPFVRASLLFSGKLDDEIQRALCDDVDVTVQILALLSPRLDESCLLEWADSDDSLAQRVILMRSQLPEKVLESLLFSSDPRVQSEAIGRKELTADEMAGFSQKSDERIRAKIACSRLVPELVQLVLADDSCECVRQLLAGNRCLLSSAVIRLLSRPTKGVLEALSGNPSVELKLLRPHFEGADGEDYLKIFACRDGLSEADLEYVLLHGGDASLYGLWHLGVDCRGMSVRASRRLARHALPSVRCLAAGASSLPLALMMELSRDVANQVRLSLARNESAPTTVLENLSNDSDAEVSKSARAGLARRVESAGVEEVVSDGSVESEENGEVRSDGGPRGLLKRLFGKSE